MPVIEARGLTRTYNGSVCALSGIDLAFEKGEFAAVTGRSGSGKSTLLNILGCLDRPNSGELRINGSPVNFRDPAALAAIRGSMIGFVFQQFSLMPHMTALENVAYPLLFSGVARSERQRRALTLLERAGLADRASHRPSELSGGEQQRVAIARALVNRPLIILADEPTGNLDSVTGAGVLELLREVNREQHATCVIVTHDMALGASAERHIRMADGRVVA